MTFCSRPFTEQTAVNLFGRDKKTAGKVFLYVIFLVFYRHFKGETGAVGKPFGPYISMVLIDNGFCNVKTQACAVLVFTSRFVNFIKAFKDISRLFGRQGNTGIVDAESHFSRTLNHLEADFSALICKLDVPYL